MSAIEFNNVWEKYRIKFIKEGKVSWEEVWALEDVSFKVDEGEVLGVIGENGAGKTTLLKLIAGMLMPDKGNVNVQGRVSTLMELGAGFNPEFTGRENILINARIYGLDEENLQRRIDRIIEFAGLDRFIDAPIKYYSQGMYMRLAFALAIYVEPDILLIDDILAVGDEEAQQKCIKKISELRGAGKTIILVSHDMNMVSKLCNRVILLERGKVIREDLPQKIIQHYLESVGDKKGIAVLAKGKLRTVFNNGKINISYDDNLLTKGMGGYLSFFNPSSNTWFPSSNFSWQIKSLSSNKIIAEGITSDEVLSQIWTLQLEDIQLKWQIEIKEEVAKEAHIDLFLMPQYKEWLTLNKNGAFPSFINKFNWQDLGLNDSPEGILGVVADSTSEAGNFPSFILEREDKDSQIKLFNTGYEQEARIIQIYSSSKKFISLDIRIFPEKDKIEDYVIHIRNQFLLKQQEELVKLRASRTISSGHLRLYADVENKAIRLYYRDKEITQRDGLHTSFLINKSWYDFTSSDWQITKEKDTLLLKFFWKLFDFTQTWKLFLKDERLIWQIDSLANTALNIDLMKFGLFLRAEYKTFFCGHQQAHFSQGLTFWQDIPLDAPQAGLFGLRKNNDLPAITLKNKHNLDCIIQNSDLSSSCRILQLGLNKDAFKDKSFSLTTELSLLEDESSIDTYLKGEKEKLLLKQKAEEEKRRLQRTISSGHLRLYADVENKAIRLYYKDKEVTKGRGLYSLFYTSKKWFNLNDAQWQIQKISEEELILILNYEFLSLSQIWTLTYGDEATLNIKIEIEVNKQISLDNWNARLELQNKYETWLTTYEGGDFLVNNQYINNIAPIRLKDSKVSKVILKSETNNHPPQLFFEVISQVSRWVLGIYKRKKENEEHVCLNFALIIPKKETLLSPGRYTYFEGNIILDKDIKLEETTLAGGLELSKGNLKLIFDRGRGKVFWGEKELTLGLGIYTSIRSSGIWYDSYQATWQINEKNDNKIIILGDWPYIPISQIWQIELIDKNSIFWKIDTEIYEELNLEIEQTNLMLSSEYKFWVIPDINKGEFLNEYTQDYDILPFRFWYGKSKRIGVIDDKLPSVLFNCNSVDDFFRAIVENTDYLYKARLLQYQKSNVAKLSPKKYTHFEGVIKIGIKD